MLERYVVKAFQYLYRLAKMMNHFKLIITKKYEQYIKWETYIDFDWQKLRDFLDRRTNKEEGKGVKRSFVL